MRSLIPEAHLLIITAVLVYSCKSRETSVHSLTSSDNKMSSFEDFTGTHDFICENSSRKLRFQKETSDKYLSMATAGQFDSIDRVALYKADGTEQPYGHPSFGGFVVVTISDDKKSVVLNQGSRGDTSNPNSITPTVPSSYKEKYTLNDDGTITARSSFIFSEKCSPIPLNGDAEISTAEKNNVITSGHIKDTLQEFFNIPTRNEVFTYLLGDDGCQVDIQIFTSPLARVSIKSPNEKKPYSLCPDGHGLFCIPFDSKIDGFKVEKFDYVADKSLEIDVKMKITKTGLAYLLYKHGTLKAVKNPDNSYNIAMSFPQLGKDSFSECKNAKPTKRENLPR